MPERYTAVVIIDYCGEH